MVFQSLLGAFITSLRPRGDDDFVDRINYFYTPVLLISAAVITSLNQYIHTPLQCWLPEGWTSNMEQYIESYCWVQNTYFLPINEHIPDEYTSREERQIPYYQWVPFILVMQACLFTCPCILWRLLNWQTGINMTQLVHAAEDILNSDAGERAKGVRCAGRCLQDVLDLQAALAVQVQPRQDDDTGYDDLNHSVLAEAANGKAPDDAVFAEQHQHGHQYQQQQQPSALGRSQPHYWLQRYNGRCLTLLYLMIKLAYVANVLVQLFLLNLLLQGSLTPVYGYLVLRDLYLGRRWGLSGHFPRVTLCDFEVRTLGNINRYTVQCTLPINLFNEKVFIFFWIWLALLFAVTLSSLLFWCCQMLFRSQRRDFIIRYLYVCAANVHRTVSPKDRALFVASPATYNHFIDDYIRCDGNFMLRVLSNQVGDVITMQIIRHLWREYRARHKREFVVSSSRSDESVLVKLRSPSEHDALSSSPQMQIDDSVDAGPNVEKRRTVLMKREQNNQLSEQLRRLQSPAPSVFIRASDHARPPTWSEATASRPSAVSSGHDTKSPDFRVSVLHTRHQQPHHQCCSLDSNDTDVVERKVDL